MIFNNYYINMKYLIKILVLQKFKIVLIIIDSKLYWRKIFIFYNSSKTMIILIFNVYLNIE